MKNISVIGAGYVGLVTAVGLAKLGHNVVCIDTNQTTVKSINRRKPPIYEDGLAALIDELINKRFRASSDYETILRTDLTLICVGTPSRADGSIDLSQIRDASARIGKVLSKKKGYHLVATRSTIVPNTTQGVIIPLIEQHSGKRINKDIGIAYNPEFLQEGKAIKAFFSPQRIIIGEMDKKAGSVVVDMYSNIGAPVFRTTLATAEMIKYASNAFLATKISFINEIANICQGAGVDVYDVVKGLSFDYRIGGEFLNAGIGFGGSCLPKDLKALVYASKHEFNYFPALLEKVIEINTAQANKMVGLVGSAIPQLRGKTIAVLGLAFKPNTNDVRNAPAIYIIQSLLGKGAKIKTYDPQAMDNARGILPDKVSFCDNAREAISGSDCVLIATEWDEFRDESLYRNKIVIDGRRALEPQSAGKLCDYKGVSW